MAELDSNQGSLAPTQSLGSGQHKGAGVRWVEGNELVISETGRYSQRTLHLESDKPRV